MRVKVYRIFLKDNSTSDISYLVDAPNKRIAKWAGANLYNNEYVDFKSAKDMIAVRFKIREE